MKRILILTLGFISLITVSARSADESSNLKMFSCTDSEFDWQQYDDKNGTALLTKNGLVIAAKKDNFCMSFCELPIDMKDDDFNVALQMMPMGFSDDKPFGVVYDVEDDSNYRMLLVMKKNFQIITVKDNKASVVKKGIYKLPKKSKDVTILVSREKGKLTFYINGLEMIKIKSPELTSPNFGFIVSPKSKLIGLGIGYEQNSVDPEEEDRI